MWLNSITMNLITMNSIKIYLFKSDPGENFWLSFNIKVNHATIKWITQIICETLINKLHFNKGVWNRPEWPTSADTHRHQLTLTDISRLFPADFFQPTFSRHPADFCRHLDGIGWCRQKVGGKSADVGWEKSRWRSASVATLAITLSLSSYFSFSSYQLLQFSLK